MQLILKKNMSKNQFKQINQLKGMLGDLGKKVDILTSLKTTATSKLDNEHMSKVTSAGAELKKATTAAMNGDSSLLTKFVAKHANNSK